MSSKTQPRSDRHPTSLPSVRYWTIFLAAVFIGLGVLGLREVWIMVRPSTSASWLKPIVDFLTAPSFLDWLAWSGVVGLGLGLVLAWAAVAPRKRTHMKIELEPTLWVRHVDIARRTSAIWTDQHRGREWQSKI